jgi:nucleoside-diphosphate-sugar epimerase
VIRSAVDPTLAREVLGWEARVPLGEGLRLTLASIAG